jgi:hypothetical protein
MMTVKRTFMAEGEIQLQEIQLQAADDPARRQTATY